MTYNIHTLIYQLDLATQWGEHEKFQNIYFSVRYVTTSTVQVINNTKRRSYNVSF